MAPTKAERLCKEAAASAYGNYQNATAKTPSSAGLLCQGLRERAEGWHCFVHCKEK